MDFQFTFVCRKQFDELGGSDSLYHFYTDCKRTVINLDALEEEEQEQLLNLIDLAT